MHQHTARSGRGLPTISFSPIEIAYYLVAAGVLALIFSLAYNWPLYLGFAAGGLGLTLHELGHKLIGRLEGIQHIHFALSPLGIGIGLTGAFLFGAVIASPGGETVGPNATPGERAWMALAGPMTNLSLFLVFAGLHVLDPTRIHVHGVVVGLWLVIGLVNLYIGAFNLLPIPGLFDGWHVLVARPLLWLAAMAATVIAVVALWPVLKSTVVPLIQLSTGGLLGPVLASLSSGVLGPVLGLTNIDAATAGGLPRGLLMSVYDTS